MIQLVNVVKIKIFASFLTFRLSRASSLEFIIYPYAKKCIKL